MKNLSIARKNMIALAVLVLPMLLTAYYLMSARDAEIDFARTEIAGVNDIRPLQTVLELLAADMPAKVDIIPAAKSLKRTLADDPLGLAEPVRTQSLLVALAGVGLSTAPMDAITQTNAMIASLGDNANITRDPDPDASLLGDIIVNRLPELLEQAKTLTNALTAAETDRQTTADHAIAETHRIAFHEAQDNLAAASAAITASLNKAILNNADGTVKPALAKQAAALEEAVGAVNAAITGRSADGVRKGIAKVIRAASAFSLPLDNTMTKLLQTRVTAYQADVFLHVAMAFVLLLIGLFLSLRIAAGIARPLQDLAAVMRHMAEGGLEVAVPAMDRGDEIGEIARATEVLRRNSLKARTLEGTQTRAEDTQETRTRNIEQALGAFNSAMKDILGTLAAATAALEDTAGGMGATAAETAAQAGSVSAAADQAAANVQTVAAAAEELSSSITEISRQVQDASAVAAEALEAVATATAGMKTLSQNAGEIGAIVELITSIAGQTNLLALNATIEAARAGDAGKGFAVVAGEVKNLAGQTAQATDSISRQIGAIQKSTGSAVSAINHINAVIEKINHAQSAIATAIEEQGAATREIARNVAEASAGNAEVSRGIGGVGAAAERGGQGAEMLKAAAQDLAGQSEMIRAEVEKFIAAVQTA